MEEQELQRLFRNYLLKKASPEEVKLLLQHFRLDNNGELLKDLIIKEIQPTITNENVISLQEHEVYQRVGNALIARIDKEQENKSHWRKSLIRFAAAAVIIIAGGYSIWTMYLTNTATAYAAYGKHLELELADNSKVTLDAGTQITYPKTFKERTRTIVLNNGEAYFDIKHDAHKPFIVKANGVNVTVLGTSFEVSSFLEDKVTKVSVTSGKVGIQLVDGKQPALFLIAGEAAIIDNATHLVRVEKKPVADIAEWRSERLIFEDDPLSDAMQRLERKYNVHIEIQNKQLLSETVSMRLNNQPLKDVLTAISFANHFNYEIVNDQLIVIK